MQRRCRHKNKRNINQFGRLKKCSHVPQEKNEADERESLIQFTPGILDENENSQKQVDESRQKSALLI